MKNIQCLVRNREKAKAKAFAHAVGVSNAAGGLGGAVRFSVRFGSKTRQIMKSYARKIKVIF